MADKRTRLYEDPRQLESRMVTEEEERALRDRDVEFRDRPVEGVVSPVDVFGPSAVQGGGAGFKALLARLMGGGGGRARVVDHLGPIPTTLASKNNPAGVGPNIDGRMLGVREPPSKSAIDEMFGPDTGLRPQLTAKDFSMWRGPVADDLGPVSMEAATASNPAGIGELARPDLTRLQKLMDMLSRTIPARKPVER